MNNLILPGSSGATMTSQQIAELVGSRHDSVKRTIERLGTQRNLSENPVIQLPPMVKVKNHLGQTVTEYVFSGEQGERDSYIVVAQLSPEFTAELVDEWRKIKNQGLTLPDFNDPAAMAIAWAEQYKATKLAIATKAEIGHRREATAMNTASQAVKRANKLEIELDQSQQWSTVKRMETITGLKFSWRLLKSAGSDLGIESKDVFDPNFGTVKAYHADVWREAYALDIKQ